MKNTILALLVMSSFSTVAADLSQAQSATSASLAQSKEGLAHSGRMEQAAQARIDDANSRAYDSGMLRSRDDVNQINHASEARANAQAEMQGYADALASAVNPQSQQVANYGVKGNPNLTAQVSGVQQSVSYSGVSQRPGYGSINVAVSSLKPDTKVNVTVNGITKTTTAAAITAVNPSVQVAVSHVPAFTSYHSGNGGNGKSAGHSSGAGDNNGQDNAHNNAMGRADGVGGHSEFR